MGLLLINLQVHPCTSHDLRPESITSGRTAILSKNQTNYKSIKHIRVAGGHESPYHRDQHNNRRLFGHYKAGKQQRRTNKALIPSTIAHCKPARSTMCANG